MSILQPFSMTEFSVTCIVPVINETFSLQQTIDMLEQQNKADILEYILAVSDTKTTKESFEVIRGLELQYGDKIIVHHQKLKFLGGAIREAFEIARGTHTILMSSDLETDPNLVKDFIRLGKERPDIIITATRWKGGGGFEGYNPFKYLLNSVFQKFFSILYRTHLSDMTYGYRIFPSSLLKQIRWEELKHSFLFETILKPLKLGVKAIEIPCKWEARKEGVSQNPFLNNFIYFRIGLKVLFLKKEDILIKYIEPQV